MVRGFIAPLTVSYCFSIHERITDSLYLSLLSCIVSPVNSPFLLPIYILAKRRSRCNSIFLSILTQFIAKAFVVVLVGESIVV